MANNVDSTNENNYTSNETNMLRVILETDWTGNGPYEWFLGAMLGTPDYFNEKEREMLNEKCNQIVLQHISTLSKNRVDQMMNKARNANPTFMEKFGRKSYNYDDAIVKGERE